MRKKRVRERGKERRGEERPEQNKERDESWLSHEHTVLVLLKVASKLSLGGLHISPWRSSLIC